MKQIAFLLITVILIISCNNNKKIENQQLIKKDLAIDDMIKLLDNISDDNYISLKLDSLDFKKRFDGIYISNEYITLNEPKHWIHIVNMHSYSSVSFSTAVKSDWERLLTELKNYGNPISFEDGTSCISWRYVGKKYTFETYEPANGVNLTSNHLYQVFVSFTTK